MLSKKNKKAYKKRRKPKYRYVPFALFVVTVMLILGGSVFFKIRSIEIAGTSKYTKEEILAASGTEPGENLITVSGSSIAASIKTALPYINRVEIEKNWPSTLVISVGESRTVAVIERESGGYYKITEDGKVLEEISQRTGDGQIEIKGLDAAETKVGETVKLKEGCELSLKYALTTLETLVSEKQEGEVTWIDVSDAGNIQFDYNARFIIEAGSGEGMENKLAVAVRIAKEVGTEKRGRILVKNEAAASFVPAE